MGPKGLDKNLNKALDHCLLNVAAKKAGTDGYGKCSIKPGPMSQEGTMVFEVDGVSTGCCDAAHAVTQAAEDKQNGPEWASDPVAKEIQQRVNEAICGLIGACGKKDQLSVMKF